MRITGQTILINGGYTPSNRRGLPGRRSRSGSCGPGPGGAAVRRIRDAGWTGYAVTGGGVPPALPQTGDMDRFEQYRVFARGGDGQFHQQGRQRAGAAALLCRPPSSSWKRNWARLLHRTTRQVRLTRRWRPVAGALVAAAVPVEDIDHLFQRKSPAPGNGRLNVDVLSRPARRLVAPALRRACCGAIPGCNWRWGPATAPST